jgi:thiamine-monophosphate kinase
MPSSEPESEFGLINWIRVREQANAFRSPWTRLGLGDDCAILDVGPRSSLLVTTDMLMDGRHFRLEGDTPEQVGHKALGVNLSDIAAMAGMPRAAVIAVALPRKHATGIAQGIHAGMAALAERFAVDLIGGDTNAWGGPLVISITVIGEATERGAVRRSGAKPGDAILVTGPLGGSLHAGRHLRVEPRINEALALHAKVPLHAMIDLSDGLSSDLLHILAESGGLGAVLDESAIPIHPDASMMSRIDSLSPLEHALHDGEDFELCVVLPAADAARLLADPALPVRLHRIGKITEAPGLNLRSAGGELQPISPHGFDHFH